MRKQSEDDHSSIVVTRLARKYEKWKRIAAGIQRLKYSKTVMGPSIKTRGLPREVSRRALKIYERCQSKKLNYFLVVFVRGPRCRYNIRADMGELLKS
jgi:hypothetical protein